MKFWQLISILYSEKKLIYKIALKHNEWKFISDWLNEYDTLVNTQDRNKLDYQLPNQFIREVLKCTNLKYYLSQDGIWLRSWKIASDDNPVTALEAFDTYGGNALEEAVEFGSFKLKDENTPHT